MPRINDFFDQVQRLPDVRLTGYRQQIFNTPLYYESQTSAGYYERYFAGTNTLFGQTNGTVPQFCGHARIPFINCCCRKHFFGWLNVTPPRVGARATWYSSESGPPGRTNSQTIRAVFNTGVDVSFKASRNSGLRRRIRPVGHRRPAPYHPCPPSRTPMFPRRIWLPDQVPQFDTQLPSLMVQPIEFPDYNDIDDIYKENVIRWGIRNTLQTKRNGQLDNLLDWNVMLDWNLRPTGQTNSVFLQPQKTFDDLYSDLAFKPRSWITGFNSQFRYNVNVGQLNLAFHQIDLFAERPLEPGASATGICTMALLTAAMMSSPAHFFTGLNENYGLRGSQYYNAELGRLQEQDYSLYRDMRSFTAAVTFRLIDNGGGQPLDYGFAFSISLKAIAALSRRR